MRIRTSWAPTPTSSSPSSWSPPEAAARHQGPVLTWLRGHQGVLFFPILLLEGLSLHASSVRRMFVRGRLERRWAEITFLSVRMIGYLVLVFIVLSPGIAFVFLAVQLGLFGFYMGIAFAPNHKRMPVVPRDMTLDFLRRQVLMSRNVRGGRFLDVAMGGLNYQVVRYINRVGLGERDIFSCPLAEQRLAIGVPS